MDSCSYPRPIPHLAHYRHSFFTSPVLGAVGGKSQLHPPGPSVRKPRSCMEPVVGPLFSQGALSLQRADVQLGSLKLSLGVGLDFSRDLLPTPSLGVGVKFFQAERDEQGCLRR